MYAYYAKQGNTHFLYIQAQHTPNLEHDQEYVVSGKVAARKLAKELGATPWNF